MYHHDSQPIEINELTDIQQRLNLWNAQIESHFKADGQSVDVITLCEPDKNAVAYRISSPLLKEQQARIGFVFPYPTGRHADDASDWTNTDRHTCRQLAYTEHSTVLEHRIDNTTYYIYMSWEGKANFSSLHAFELIPHDNELAFSVEYSPVLRDINADKGFRFSDAQKATQKFWHQWWTETAFADFSQCTDPRAKELERRVVLSQYLTRINCANNMPPQETGLTYNSWYGRPHLEMTWWHAVDFALWNQPQVVERMLEWYNNTAAPVAKKIAERQSFKGLRWMKMTDPWAGEAPSNTGSFLIWQQPHYIYMAEEMYRANPTEETLKKYAEQVEATAEFMADFVTYDKTSKRYFLKGETAMQESMSKDFSYNHPFELAYWQYGLNIANQWRERQGKPRHSQWDDIIRRLSLLPEADGIYTAGLPTGQTNNLSSFDPFDAVASGAKPAVSTETFASKCRSDHPAILGACGILPGNKVPYTLLYDMEKMKATLD